jgi:DNA (cytosine-5)-methyltransferase 1
MPLTALDLFCGCGGLTAGLKLAGFKVVGAVDNDPLAVRTYKMNHNRTEVWQERIQDVKVGTVKRRLGLRKGDLDLLAGCPPCQGFSSMRTLNGRRDVEDVRNDLVFDFLRFVEGLAPKAVMMENVPGLLGDKRMKRFSKRLKELGYVGEPRILDAAGFGVPQRRRRMILMAARDGVTIEFPTPSDTRVTVRQTIGSLPKSGTSGDPLHDVIEERQPKVAALIKRIPKDGGSRWDLGIDAQLACHRRSDGFYDVYGRMAWGEVAPTITGGFVNPSKGRFLHPDEHRCVTLREGALLQGFPPNYVFPLDRGKYAVAQMIGNALPPEFIRRHAAAIASALREGESKNATSRKAPNR